MKIKIRKNIYDNYASYGTLWRIGKKNYFVIKEIKLGSHSIMLMREQFCLNCLVSKTEPDKFNLIKVEWGEHLEDDIIKFLEDRQYYDNFGRSIMLPDDAGQFAGRLEILIRQQIIKWKNARRSSC